MAIGMTVLDGQSLTLNDSTPNDGATEWISDGGGDIQAGSGEFWTAVTVQIKITPGSSPSGDVTIHSRKSADSGTTEDDVSTEMWSYTPTASTAFTKSFDFYNFVSLDIAVENQTGEAITLTSMKYSGTKLTGLATS